MNGNLVAITRHMIGICHMQVCVTPDATDAEILEVCNRQNPSGTSMGWSKVLRDPNKEGAPVPCEQFPDRIHLLVSC